MRIFAIPLLLLFAGSAKICSSSDKASADASAKVDASAAVSASAATRTKAALAPRIGGITGLAGDFTVELAVHQSGLVEALVSDASGKLVSEGVK